MPLQRPCIRAACPQLTRTNTGNAVLKLADYASVFAHGSEPSATATCACILTHFFPHRVCGSRCETVMPSACATPLPLTSPSAWRSRWLRQIFLLKIWAFAAAWELQEWRCWMCSGMCLRRDVCLWRWAENGLDPVIYLFHLCCWSGASLASADPIPLCCLYVDDLEQCNFADSTFLLLSFTM